VQTGGKLLSLSSCAKPGEKEEQVGETSGAEFSVWKGSEKKKHKRNNFKGENLNQRSISE